MQTQLIKTSNKPQANANAGNERILGVAELLLEEHNKVNKLHSGSSTSTLNNATIRTSVTSSPYDMSSNDNQYTPKGLAYRKKLIHKKTNINTPIVHTHAVCLNHITAQPYCSIDVNDMFKIFPKYYRNKYKYVMRWLRKNFGRAVRPKPPPLNQDSSSSSSSSSSSTSTSSSDITSSSESSDFDSSTSDITSDIGTSETETEAGVVAEAESETETETIEDIQSRPLKKRRHNTTSNSSSSSTSESETTSTTSSESSN